MSWKRIRIAMIAFLIGAIISWQVFWSYAWEGTLTQKDPNTGAGIESDILTRFFEDWTQFYIPTRYLLSYNGLLTSLLAMMGFVLLMIRENREGRSIPVAYWIASLLGIYLIGLPVSLGYRVRFIHATVEPATILASVAVSRLEDKRSNPVKFGMILYLVFKIWFALEFLELLPRVLHELPILGAEKWTIDFLP